MKNTNKIAIEFAMAVIKSEDCVGVMCFDCPAEIKVRGEHSGCAMVIAREAITRAKKPSGKKEAGK